MASLPKLNKTVSKEAETNQRRRCDNGLCRKMQATKVRSSAILSLKPQQAAFAISANNILTGYYNY